MFCPKCKFEIRATPRSTQQNRAYFGIAVRKLAQESNVSPEAMHKALAGEFLGFEEFKVNGKIVRIEKSTARLTATQFSEYYEKIQRYAAENGIDIPDPNELANQTN